MPNRETREERRRKDILKGRRNLLVAGTAGALTLAAGAFGVHELLRNDNKKPAAGKDPTWEPCTPEELQNLPPEVDREIKHHELRGDKIKGYKNPDGDFILIREVVRRDSSACWVINNSGKPVALKNDEISVGGLPFKPHNPDVIRIYSAPDLAPEPEITFDGYNGSMAILENGLENRKAVIQLKRPCQDDQDNRQPWKLTNCDIPETVERLTLVIPASHLQDTLDDTPNKFRISDFQVGHAPNYGYALRCCGYLFSRDRWEKADSGEEKVKYDIYLQTDNKNGQPLHLMRKDKDSIFDIRSDKMLTERYAPWAKQEIDRMQRMERFQGPPKQGLVK